MNEYVHIMSIIDQALSPTFSKVSLIFFVVVVGLKQVGVVDLKQMGVVGVIHVEVVGGIHVGVVGEIHVAVVGGIHMAVVGGIYVAVVDVIPVAVAGVILLFLYFSLLSHSLSLQIQGSFLPFSYLILYSL